MLTLSVSINFLAVRAIECNQDWNITDYFRYPFSLKFGTILSPENSGVCKDKWNLPVIVYNILKSFLIERSHERFDYKFNDVFYGIPIWIEFHSKKSPQINTLSISFFIAFVTQTEWEFFKVIVICIYSIRCYSLLFLYINTNIAKV